MNKLNLEKATICEVSQIYRIMYTVYNSMEDKTQFLPDDKSFVIQHIAKYGFILVAKCNKKIAGYLIVRLPKLEKDNLGYDINLPQDMLYKVAHFESTAILPKYRGQALQAKLFKKAENILKAEGIKIIMATVSPKNIPSNKSFEKCGFKCKITKKKYNNLTRKIMFKSI